MDLEGEGRVLLKLEQLALGQSGLDQLGLNGALLCADLQTDKGFLGGIGVGVAGLDDQQLRAGLIQVAEVDLLGTLGGVGEGRDAEVHLTGLDGGDDAVEGHVHDLQLNAEAVGDLLGQPHIAAGEVGVEILELIGSVLGFGADDDLALGLDLLKQGGGLGGLLLFLLLLLIVSGLLRGVLLAAAGHHGQQHRGAERQRQQLLHHVKVFHLFLRSVHLYARFRI